MYCVLMFVFYLTFLTKIRSCYRRFLCLWIFILQKQKLLYITSFDSFSKHLCTYLKKTRFCCLSVWPVIQYHSQYSYLLIYQTIDKYVGFLFYYFYTYLCFMFLFINVLVGFSESSYRQFPFFTFVFLNFEYFAIFPVLFFFSFFVSLPTHRPPCFVSCKKTSFCSFLGYLEYK